MRRLFSLSDNGLGFTVSSALLGTIAGALLAGRPSEQWGRRKTLGLLAALFVVSAFGCALAPTWSWLLLARFVGGLAVGGASVVCPMYIAEIAPARNRGLLVAVSQLNIVVGILAAYFSNWIVARSLGAEYPDAWRWMFGVMAAPALVFLVATVLIPESPRWLVGRQRPDEARRALGRLGHATPEKEVAEIFASLAGQASPGHERIFARKYRKPLLIVCALCAFGQLDGINAIIYYTADIFRMAGYEKADALMQAVLIGAANLILTVVAMALIDRLGRKPLLLAGCVTFVIFHLLAAWVFATHAQGWIVLAAMMGIVGSHAFSVGGVIWPYINEMLPNAVRASGSAVACSVMWVFCALVSWTFPVIAGASGMYAFGFFALMMAIFFVLVWKYFPETKGVSLEDLQKRLVPE